MAAIDYLRMLEKHGVEIPQEIIDHLATFPKTSTRQTAAEVNAERCEMYNSNVGNLNLQDGYDCEICKNRGDIALLRGEEMVLRVCSCMQIRKSVKYANQSGIMNELKLKKFKNFNAVAEWQQGLKNNALDFVKNHDNNWFYIGGQAGCGKTHLCTAVVGELIGHYGIPAKYYIWSSIVGKLKTLKVNNYSEYESLLSQVIGAETLYLDDFLKVPKRADKLTMPTDSDLAIAFEIINGRYCRRNAITIISGEFALKEILNDLDNALGSRIFEMCGRGKYVSYVAFDNDKNYRIKGNAGYSNSMQH